MWLGKRTVQSRRGRQTDVGLVTIGGSGAGVYTNLEKRQVAAYAPGGYFWVPKAGKNMLLVRAADGESCIAGAEQTDCPRALTAGEVFIMSDQDAAHIFIQNGGSIQVLGSMTVDGGLHVSGNVSISGTLSVTGGIILNGNRIE